jgi:hypothetical protein
MYHNKPPPHCLTNYEGIGLSRPLPHLFFYNMISKYTMERQKSKKKNHSSNENYLI